MLQNYYFIVSKTSCRLTVKLSSLPVRMETIWQMRCPVSKIAFFCVFISIEHNYSYVYVTG